MERLESFEEYAELLRESKKRGFTQFINNYLDMDAVKRYIELGRIEYGMDGSGLYLYTDEGLFYRLYILCGEYDVKPPKRDKPVLVRNVYRKDNKSASQIGVEEQLQRLGFSRYSETVQILSIPMENRNAVLEKLEKAERFLGRFGLKIVYADSAAQLEDIYRLRDSTSELKPYHFPYETMEEKQQAVEKGFFRCVVNARNELCAAQQFRVGRNGAQGNWLAVEVEYKEKYGIGAAMVYHAFAYAIEHKIRNYFGWVEKDNEKSLRFHQSAGYRLTGKVAEDWIL